MKRLVAGGLLFLFVAIGVFILWERGAESLLPSQIAPAECMVYVELPKFDGCPSAGRIRRSLRCWKNLRSSIFSRNRSQRYQQTGRRRDAHLPDCGVVRCFSE